MVVLPPRIGFSPLKWACCLSNFCRQSQHLARLGLRTAQLLSTRPTLGSAEAQLLLTGPTLGSAEPSNHYSSYLARLSLRKTQLLSTEPTGSAKPSNSSTFVDKASNWLARLSLRITARTCFQATLQSKSLVELAYFLFEDAEATARTCFEALLQSKSLVELAYFLFEEAEV